MIENVGVDVKYKKMLKVLIFIGMILIFLLLFFIFALIAQTNATAENLKQIKLLEERIKILESR